MTEITRVWEDELREHMSREDDSQLFVFKDASEPPQYAFGYTVGANADVWQLQMFGPMDKETAEHNVDPTRELVHDGCDKSLTFELHRNDQRLGDPEAIAHLAAAMILGSQVVSR